jgi:hypothetical protein
MAPAGRRAGEPSFDRRLFSPAIDDELAALTAAWHDGGRIFLQRLTPAAGPALFAHTGIATEVSSPTSAKPPTYTRNESPRHAARCVQGESARFDM